MNPSNLFKILFILALIATNIGCDQISKSAVRKQVNTNENISLLGENLILTKVENTGAFLSLGTAWPEAGKTAFLYVLPVLALLAGTGYVFFKRGLSIAAIVAMSLIISGGIGNLYDRFVYRSVTDFLYLEMGAFHTGIFNLADVSIMLGTSLLLVQYLFKHKYFFNRTF